MTDLGGSTRFKYDHRGNLLIKQQAIGTTSAAELVNTYDLADRITSITYPSGLKVSYDRDVRGRVTTVRAKPTPTASEVVLASNMTYEPFGPLISATFGNGLSLTQTWVNRLGRLSPKRLYRTATGVDVSSLSYGYDNDDNITAILDAIDPTRNVTYNYDSVDRLTRSVAASGSARRQDFNHDVNGNRTSVEVRALPSSATPLSTATYALTPGTNRLASVVDPSGTRSISYDGNGNTSAETRPGAVTVSAGYDGHGRLTSYTSAGTNYAHVYNGLDDRISTTQGSDIRRFVYDASGRLLGEYGAAATDVKAETIWLLPEVESRNLPFGGDDGVGGYAPLAISTSSSFIWAHGNHLGVPIVLTDATGAIASPTGFTRVGFPGQTQTLADLYYNRHRDYDPVLGRYIQSDPIGLQGGSNVYLYADANPLKYTDPNGLQASAINVVCRTNPLSCAVPAIINGLLGRPGGPAGPDIPDLPRCEVPPDQEKCEIAKADAARAYRNLVNKRIPQYTSGGTRGPDENHYKSILEKQSALRDAIRRVRLYCRPLPPELAEWERVANLVITPWH